MWFTKDADGFRGWFRAQQPNGKLRVGLPAGAFVVTIRDAPNATSSVVPVTESGKGGLYFFDVPPAFLAGGGLGEYGVVAEVDTKASGAGPPHVVATFSETLRVNAQNFGDFADVARQILIEKILRNKLITDPVAGTITVFDDDDTTPLISASIFEDVAASQAYRGAGVDRRERLT